MLFILYIAIIFGMQSSPVLVWDCYSGADIWKSYLLTWLSLWSTGYYSTQPWNTGDGEGMTSEVLVKSGMVYGML